MMKFAPNTLTLFNELEPRQQLAAIRRAGFEYVEFLFPYLAPVEEVTALLDATGVGICLMDVLPGDVRNLDISAAIDPKRKEEYRRYAHLALQYAVELKVPYLNCISGSEHAVADATPAEMLDVYKENLAFTCDLFRESDTVVLIEPVSEFQFPGYLMRDLHTAVAMMDELNRPNLSLQFDFFHNQLLHGNLIGNVERYWDRIAYFQIANPPRRNEPGVGEVDFVFVLRELARRGYDGFVGLEYEPSGTSGDAFRWIEAL